MQFASVPPVVNTIGGRTALLHFKDEVPAPNRMDEACRNVKNIAFVGRMTIDAIRQSIQVFRSWHCACPHFRFAKGFENVPQLVFGQRP